ncbi:hypothetical protein C2E23DRAFT_451790 [Lenzites betulinus]|nr:hypothetical protein C2E23DRAFT_451790 [Lenzites betulinus]
MHPARALAAPSRKTSSALICDELYSFTLSTAEYPMPFADFAADIRSHPKASTLPITCFEMYMEASPSGKARLLTMLTVGHQYIVATVLLPDGRKTYIKADYMSDTLFGGKSRLEVSLGDHYAKLTRASSLVSRISSPPQSPPPGWGPNGTHSTTPPPPPPGPSLADLATLFEIADQRICTQKYNFFGHNCIWMAEMLFYTLARQFDTHWLAGVSSPAWLVQKFLRAEMTAAEVVDTVALIGSSSSLLPSIILSSDSPGEALFKLAIGVGSRVARETLASLEESAMGKRPYLMHDDEMKIWIEMWGSIREHGGYLPSASTALVEEQAPQEKEKGRHTGDHAPQLLARSFRSHPGLRVSIYSMVGMESRYNRDRWATCSEKARGQSMDIYI